MLVSTLGASAQQRAAAPEGQPGAAGRGRGQPIGLPRLPLGEGPFVFDTAEQHKIRVVVVARGIPQPWSLQIKGLGA